MRYFPLYKRIIAFVLSFTLSYYVVNTVRGSSHDKDASASLIPSYTNVESSEHYVDTLVWVKMTNRIIVPTAESAIFRAYLSLAKYEGKAACQKKYNVVLCDNSWIITTYKDMDNVVGGGHYFEIDKLSGRINVSLGMK